MNEERTDWSDVPATDLTVTANADPEVEEIAADIEQTRNEMTGTVDAIGEKLDPRNIVQGAKETVREATVGKVEHMAQSAGDMVGQAGYSAQQAGSGLMETIKRNPIPAAMAGIGIGWLWMNRQNASSSSWSSSGRWSDGGYDGGRYGMYSSGSHGGGMTSELGSRASGAADSVSRTASDAADTVGRTASQAADTVTRTVGDVAGTASQTAGQVPQQLGGMARQVGDNTGRMLEENALAVGAVALAVGTAIGLALPTTKTEHRVMGQASTRLIDDAESTVHDQMQQVEQQARQQA